MEIWHGFLKLLDTRLPGAPQAGGTFHLVSIALSLILAAVLCFLYQKGIIKSVVKVVVVISALVMALEILKQINYSFTEKNDFAFDYQWYAFPWQFCSTPMYVGLLAGIIRKGRVHRALCAFLATFGLFAGLCVMALPGDVFIDTLIINIQTMVCHGSMVAMGIFLFYTNYVKLEFKSIVRAVPVFAAVVGIAVVLNETAFRTGLLETEEFNMFFISPYCEPSLIIYRSVQEAVPFPWCLLFYIGGFTLASTVVLLLVMAVAALCKRAAKFISGAKNI